MSTDRARKLQIAAGVVAGFVVAVALGAVGALAISSAFSDDDENRAAAIEQATVEPDDTSDSLTEALEFLVDEAVEAGRLTEEEGERLKEALESGQRLIPIPSPDGELFRDPGSGGFGLDLFRTPLDLDAAAEYLDLTSSVLEDELEDGKTLAEIAREQGKSVDGLVQVLVDATNARIDDAVADGRLSLEQAAQLEENLEDRIRERVEEELPPRAPFDLPFELRPEFERGFSG